MAGTCCLIFRILAAPQLSFDVTPQFSSYIGTFFFFKKRFACQGSSHNPRRKSISYGSNVGVFYEFNDVVTINASMGFQRFAGFDDDDYNRVLANAAFRVFFYF